VKIACIATSQVPSSTANSIQLMKVSHSLAGLGHEVRVYVPGTENAGWPELAARYGLSKEFQVTWIKSVRSLRRYDFTWSSVRQAQDWGADLIYTWLPQVGTLAMRRGLPAVLELHDRPTGLLGPFFVRRFIQMRGKKLVLLITRALQNEVEKGLDLKIQPGEVLIAPNGVEAERYANLPNPGLARAQLGLSERVTAVYTGHFYQGRGIELLIGLARRFPEVQFLWVGGTPKSCAELKARLTKEGIENAVLPGFVDNTRLPLYQAAGEISLMPYERSIAGSSGGNSADICSPMKMFEYLACGRAILSSDLPVLHEVLNDTNACFCEPENLESWAAGMKRLVEDPSFRQGLSARALATAAHFTWRERARLTLQGIFTGQV
jgi:glycosyltransferase involved in cell wall biosynthesis